jgi:isoquinoline 1-oxidoreductase beta subunit
MAHASFRGLLSRRSFFVSAGITVGALAVGFRLPRSGREAISSVELLNWVVVKPDDTIMIRIAQMEMGQGAITTMVQLLAEELDADWSKIKTEFISISTHLARHRAYGRTDTSGGLGLRMSERPLRTVGAQIRAMLVRTAAQRLSVNCHELVTKTSTVVHPPTGRILGYGDLAEDAAKLDVPNPKSIRLKDRSDWKYLGHSMPRLDLPAKIDGSAIFGADVKLDGMKYAAIAISPAFGGKLKSCDGRVALSFPGVRKVVSVKGIESADNAADAIAVIADSWWQATKALNEIPIKWEGGSVANDASILAGLRTGLEGAPDQIVREHGDVPLAMSTAVRSLQKEYFVPYLEQATMEPMNCTALVTDNRFEIWAPTQDPEEAIGVAAEAAGMSVNSGELHPTLIGGGFGRRINTDVICRAVHIAKAMKGVPIKVLWSREQTLRHSFYRQASLSKIRGGLDANGELFVWTHRIIAQSTEQVHSTFGAGTLLYAIPNMKVEFVVRPSDVPVGSMRGVGYSLNCFAVQSFIDEAAKVVGSDTYQFQRDLLDPSKTLPFVPSTHLDHDIPPRERAARLRAVLDEAAIKAGWGSTMAPNQGRGLAAHEQSGGFWAAVVEVTLNAGGWLKIDRVVVVGDPGSLAHPDNANAQVEGSVAFGLSSALYGQITIMDGSVVESNFHDYQVVRMHEMPKVEIHWLLDREFWGDVTQAVVGLMAPALTNAIYDAGGERIRSLPIKNKKIVRRDMAHSPI